MALRRNSKSLKERFDLFKMIFGLDIKERKKRELKAWKQRLNFCTDCGEFIKIFEEKVPLKWEDILLNKNNYLSFENFISVFSSPQPWGEMFPFFLHFRNIETSMKKSLADKEQTLKNFQDIIDKFLFTGSTIAKFLSFESNNNLVLKNALSKLEDPSEKDPHLKVKPTYDFICFNYIPNFFRCYFMSEQFYEFQRAMVLADTLTNN